MGRQNSNLRKIGSRPGPLADWNVGASVGTFTASPRAFGRTVSIIRQRKTGQQSTSIITCYALITTRRGLLFHHHYPRRGLALIVVADFLIPVATTTDGQLQNLSHYKTRIGPRDVAHYDSEPKAKEIGWEAWVSWSFFSRNRIAQLACCRASAGHVIPAFIGLLLSPLSNGR
jgi:hypothetical protein